MPGECQRPARVSTHDETSGSLTSFCGRHIDIATPHPTLVARFRSGFTMEAGHAEKVALLKSSHEEKLRAGPKTAFDLVERKSLMLFDRGTESRPILLESLKAQS